MSGSTLYFWLGVTLAWLSPTCVFAQRLVSDQPWSQVSILGEVSLRGILPLSVDDLPPGTYRMIIRGIGYPKAQGRLRRTVAGALETYPLNGAESFLLPPGGAHLRNPDDRVRGLVLLSSAGVSIAHGVHMNGNISQANDDIKLAQHTYDLAVTEDEIRDARVTLEVTVQESSDQEELRNLWFAATAYLWLGSALEAWILTPGPRLDPVPEGYRLSAPPASSWGAAMRSLVLPGGGQRYLGRSGRGNLYLGGVSILGIGALIAQDQYLEKRRDQMRIQRQLDLATDNGSLDRLRRDLRNAHDDTRTAEVTRWALAGLTAGTYLWNIIDAATLGSEAENTEGFSLQIAPSAEGMRAQVSWRID